MATILLSGGSGLLGSHILKLDASIVAPPRPEMDITDPQSVARALDTHKPSVFVHLAAATKPLEHEKTPEVGLHVNILGTAHVADACAKRGIRLVYTSTDYLYAGPGPHTEDEPVRPPYNFAWSKLGGECAVSLVPNHLILRLSFGPVPFPWPRVYDVQYNSKLYVDEMAPLVLRLAQTGEVGIMNVGGPKTSLLEYARRTRSEIETIAKPDWVPADTSLDISRMCRALGINDPRTLLHYAK